MPPGEQLGEPTTARRRHTRIAAIPDPFNPGGKRLLASVNIRTDLLELEHAHNRISGPALLAGREMQQMFEQATRVGAGGQWNSGDRVDQCRRKEQQIVKHLETARKIEAHAAWVRRCLGQHNIDCRILRDILGDQLSYGASAVRHGKKGDRGARYIAQRFRDALETLANAKAAKGREL